MAKSISREYQNAWRQLPHVRRRKRLAQKLRRLWRRLMFKPSKTPWLVTWSKANSVVINTRRYQFYQQAARDLKKLQSLGYYGYVIDEENAPRRAADSRKRIAELKRDQTK